jgi:hypothetical protein
MQSKSTVGAQRCFGDLQIAAALYRAISIHAQDRIFDTVIISPVKSAAVAQWLSARLVNRRTPVRSLAPPAQNTSVGGATDDFV